MNVKRVLLSLFWSIGVSAWSQELTWISSTMTNQPLPYPHYLETYGDIRDAVYSTGSIRFSPMEMLDWAYPSGKATRAFRVLGKSGKEYKGKVVQGYNTETEQIPGHEDGNWRAAAPIQEEPVAFRIYDVSPYNVLTLFYEKKIVPDLVMNIRVRETGNGGLFWKIGEGLPAFSRAPQGDNEFLRPDIALTLSQGESWADGRGIFWDESADSSQNISNLLKPGMEATFRFIVQYNFRRYVKYYTLGRGFSDTPPAKDVSAFIHPVPTYKVDEIGTKYGAPRIAGLTPPAGTTVILGKGQEVFVRLLTDMSIREMKAELNYVDPSGKKGTPLPMAHGGPSNNIFEYHLKQGDWPSGTWNLVVTVSTPDGYSTTETGATVKILP